MTDRRPNILLIMQDQLRYDSVHDDSCRTPTQDDLRRRGTDFIRAYTPLGICSPARASMLTGVYPHTHRVMNNCSGPDAINRNMAPGLPTVAEVLREAGYRTGMTGKWHVSMDERPLDRGFDEYLVTDREAMEMPMWKRFKDQTPDAVMTRYPPPSPRLAERFPRRPFPMYSTETVPEDMVPATAVATRSGELLRRYAQEEQPFFLFVSFIEPHWPNVLPEPYASMYDPADIPPWPNFYDPFVNKPGSNLAGLEHFGVTDFTWERDWAPVVARYLGAVSFIDDLMGRILTDLEESGLADDTIVLSTADHGDMTGSHRQFNKGPLMYEEVYHIPFTVSGPGVNSGVSTDALASLIDIMPTCAEIAGVDAPPNHGRSLMPVLAGDEEGWRDALMCEFHGDEFGLCSQRMIRSGKWKLVYNSHDMRELYDLDADPHELQNLAYDPGHAEVRRDLENRLIELIHDSDDMLRLWTTNVLA